MTWWPLDDYNNAKFNPKPTRLKPNALKTTSINNIQAI
jgi:hypothetical protein